MRREVTATVRSVELEAAGGESGGLFVLFAALLLAVLFAVLARDSCFAAALLAVLLLT